MFTTPATIKASRIAHLTDARYFAAQGVDFLGFNLEEGTEGYLDPVYMKAIREWVEGPKIVGEFEHTPVRVIREAAVFYGLDAVQVSAQKHGAGLEELADLEVILAIEINTDEFPVDPQTLSVYAAHADFFLFKFAPTIDWKPRLLAATEHWRALFCLRPALIQADLPTQDWPEMIQTLGLAGVSLVGGEEERVGVKSYDEMEAIFELLRS